MMEPKLDHLFTLRISEQEQQLLTALPASARAIMNQRIRDVIRQTIEQPRCPACGAVVGQGPMVALSRSDSHAL